MKTTQGDIVWSYFAQFFSLASGLIILPLILNKLTSEEIGMNYLMLTVSSLVSLFDFGFAPQFSRNISYIFSGAQSLKKIGFEENQVGASINYRLLATAIHTSRSVYKVISIIVLFVMLTFGSMYMYFVTDGFVNVKNSIAIWIIFSISTFFNIYFNYYNSLLIGNGLIKESKKALVYSRLAYILLSVIFLFFNFGLLGVIIANLISPFISRLISHRSFFTNELNSKLAEFKVSKKEKKDLFTIIWFNSKKLGLVLIGSYAITRFGMFLAGLYLPLSEVSSYGLMIQLVGIIVSVSSTLFNVYSPKFAELRINNNNDELLYYFSRSMGFFYLIFVCGGFILIFAVPFLLSHIQSNVFLPSTLIVFIYLIVSMLEQNHSIFSSMIVIGNSVPFMGIALISGAFIIVFSYLSLSYTSLGVLGLVVSQGFVQLVYNNWKWPFVVCQYFRMNFLQFFYLSIKHIVRV